MPQGGTVAERAAVLRAFSPSNTDAMDDVLTGTGNAAIVLPTFVRPPLPVGVPATLPGVLNHIFVLIAQMKTSPNYTETIGTDLGVVGVEETPKATTRFSAEMRSQLTALDALINALRR